jgi:hypothetical protein
MRDIVKFELITEMLGAGVAVGSVLPFTALTDRLKQHPFGTVTIAVEVTLLYSSTAAGVTIALLVGRSSPFTAIDTAIGPTVPPSGRLMFPLNTT